MNTPASSQAESEATAPATTEPPSACVRDVGTTIDGADILFGYYNARTADACCRACNLRSDCKQWSWGGGVCWRKGVGGRRNSRRGMVSGTRCASCGVQDESLPLCENATEGSSCQVEINDAMKRASTRGGEKCAVRGFGLLPDDEPHAFQSYLFENEPSTRCLPPCITSDPSTLLLRLDPSDALPGRMLVIGIPSACREDSNLAYLARRLVHHAAADLGALVRFVAWQSHSAADDTADAEALRHLGFTVAANRAGYTPFSLRTTLGDPAARVRWRSTEALDYSRLLGLAYAERTQYVLIVQDDTFAAPDVGQHLRKVCSKVPSFLFLYLLP